jgi:hypothetical protein
LIDEPPKKYFGAGLIGFRVGNPEKKPNLSKIAAWKRYF